MLSLPQLTLLWSAGGIRLCFKVNLWFFFILLISDLVVSISPLSSVYLKDSFAVFIPDSDDRCSFLGLDILIVDHIDEPHPIFIANTGITSSRVF